MCGVRMHLILEDVALKRYTEFQSHPYSPLVVVKKEFGPMITERYTNKDVILIFINLSLVRRGVRQSRRRNDS